MIKAVLCLFCVNRLSRLSECIRQTLLQVWALTRWSDFEVLSIKTSKKFRIYLSKMSSLDTMLFVSLCSITMLRFYIMKVLLELFFLPDHVSCCICEWNFTDVCEVMFLDCMWLIIANMSCDSGISELCIDKERNK